MVKMANLAGVAHNIAHHSASSLSCLSPHMAQALRASGKETVVIELLEPHPYPPQIVELQRLRLALASLKRTAQEMLLKHGFTQDDVLSMYCMPPPHPGIKTAIHSTQRQS